MGVCHLFKGTEDVEELLDIFCSVQGMEYCMKHSFPNISTMRLFKNHDPELLIRKGIYLDAGAVNLRNPRRVIMIGKTSASIYYDTMEEHNVYVLRGAKCAVSAWKWSVLRVESDSTSKVLKNPFNHAIIL